MTGEQTLIPLAGPANRQGRIAADAIMGRWVGGVWVGRPKAGGTAAGRGYPPTSSHVLCRPPPQLCACIHMCSACLACLTPCREPSTFRGTQGTAVVSVLK